jgi:hypothetical protein
MIRILHSILILTSVLIGYNKKSLADDVLAKKFKYGKVEATEFNVKPTGKDSSAAAVILFDIGEVSFSIGSTGKWNYKFTRHKRIKILTKDGYDYANFEIPIYKSNNLKEALTNVSAASYNIEKEKIVQTKVLKDEKFTDKHNSYWTINKFTLSNIKPGTIVEVKYEITSEDIFNLRSWYFQQEIPILLSDFSLDIPEYFDYKINHQSLVKIDLVSNTVKRQTFTGIASSSDVSRADSYNFSCNTVARRWLAKDVFAFKNEPFITTSDDYITKIEFELRSTNFPSDMVRNYSNSWQKITTELAESESFGKMLRPSNYSKELINKLNISADSSFQKMNKIYNYLKNEVKWNEKKSIYSSHSSIKALLETKSGNSSDINLGLVNILKTSGLKAHPVLISTRSNGRHPGIPMISKFNYVIAATEINDKFYFLDATDGNYTINCPSKEALNHQGLLVDIENKSGEWKAIEPEYLSKSNITNIFALNNDLELTGTILNFKTHYAAQSAKNKFKQAVSQEEYIKNISSKNSGLKITSFKNDIESSEEIFTETISATISDWVEEAGNLIYLNPLLFERTKENPFKSDERLFPVDFAIPNEETYKFIFTIPEGYSVEKLPASIAFKLEDNSASFSYSALKSDQQILITSKITIKGTLYPSEKFFELKELFKNIVSKQEEPIVLKKI